MVERGVARCGPCRTGNRFSASHRHGATFDNATLYEVFSAVSDEARAKNHLARENNSYERYQGLTFWTPNINIFRDPRWGRGQETYGEDPYLTSQMGMAVVRGLQSPEGSRYDKAHACAKHYAVHSGPEWNRHSFNVEDLDPRDLWETYLPAFKDLVQKTKVKEVMCAYQRFEGDPCCGSDRLLTQILREEWRHEGIVVSDCGAINDFFEKGHHETHEDAIDASSDAVLTGTDLECGDVYAALTKAAEEEMIKEEDIDRSLRRLLKARFELGEMDETTPWDSIPASVIDSKEHRSLALHMARESMVLLQNKNNILPLKDNMTVALIGPNANDSVMQWGNYNGFPSHTVTLLEALQQRLPEARLIYAPACDRVSDEVNIPELMQQIKPADIALFAGGIAPSLEGEEMQVNAPGFKGGDRTDIELPAVQRKVMAALKAAGKKVVLINFSGSAIGLVPETASCEAILQAWYPGQAGGTAIADVLFGDYNPAGRLPVTFYRDITQVPDFEDYAMAGRTYRYMSTKPLFPFGYGLSYTTFAYGQAKIEGNSLLVPVTNTGKTAGEEVVQLYLQRPDDKEGPKKTLRGFSRVSIQPGETAMVKFDLDAETFNWWDEASNTVRPLEGNYTLLYGSSSDDRDLKSISYSYSL